MRVVELSSGAGLGLELSLDLGLVRVEGGKRAQRAR